LPAPFILKRSILTAFHGHTLVGNHYAQHAQSEENQIHMKKAASKSPKGLTQATAGILCLLVAAGCVRETSPVTGQKRFYAYSWQQEQQLGREADQQMIEQFGEYDDPALLDYVSAVGQRVLEESDLRKPDAPEQYRTAPFHFRVVDSPVVNAFALPGGYVYVTRGLLSHLQNEAQLAVVLGHEIGHVAARHASRQALKAQAGQLGLIAGVIVGQQVLDDPQAAGQMLNLGGALFQLLLTKYSRDAERESDDLGVEYAAREGYDAAEGAEFFRTLQRMSEQQGAILPSWQSTHPDPGEREQAIIRLARELNPEGTPTRTGEETYLRHIDGLVLGQDPREGFVRNGVFYHPELRFQFSVPKGWHVQNERAAVLLIAPERGALLVLEIIPAQSAQEAASRLAKTQGIQVVSATPLQTHGLTAVRVMAQANTQQGAAAIINYFIEYGGKVYSFLGYSSAANFKAYLPEFQQTAEAFQTVTTPQVLKVAPSRLAIVTAQKNGPFRSFLPSQMPPGLTPLDLAILNQVELDEPIPRGKLLKLPR
jgi:predicted Zn-dependent protease